jgi:hypothetical protein
MESYTLDRLIHQVDAALERVKTILEVNRKPNYPAELQHQYQDKYGLAVFLTNTSISAVINVLELLGLNSSKLTQLKGWSDSRSITLRFVARENCTFIKEVTKRIDADTEHHTDISGGLLGEIRKIISKNTITIKEYHWQFSMEYELFCFAGNNSEEKVTLQQRNGKYEIVTRSESAPSSEAGRTEKFDLNLTWLLQQINPEFQCQFQIDRMKKSCRTPRRNEDIERALQFFRSLHYWNSQIINYFKAIFKVQQNHYQYTAHGKEPKATLNINSLSDTATIFNPVQPLFEHRPPFELTEQKASSLHLVALNNPNVPWPAAPVLPTSDVNLFLAEQKRSILEKLAELAKTFPSAEAAELISYVECVAVVGLEHSKGLAQALSDGIEFIEDLLHSQLVAAIGKELQPADFVNYMNFHQRKLFRTEFLPNVFSYAVRRPEHFPEGIVSIESQLSDGSLAEPVLTTVRKLEKSATQPMNFSLDASTTVTFNGERYLHALLNHSFAGDTGSSLQLVARARQFSSFIVLLGRINSATSFDPKYAFMLQNKDDLKIPLELEQIPTPKEFRDAIESLSPEQQRFCKAYRSMQLESSLLGVVIIQIKPQMEKLLNLPADSLTKEIKLMEEIIELFSKYHIPPDQLSYDEQINPEATNKQKIEIVRGYTQAIRQLISKIERGEIDMKVEEAQLAQYSRQDEWNDGEGSLANELTAATKFSKKGRVAGLISALSAIGGAGRSTAEPQATVSAERSQKDSSMDKKKKKVRRSEAAAPAQAAHVRLSTGKTNRNTNNVITTRNVASDGIQPSGGKHIPEPAQPKQAPEFKSVENKYDWDEGEAEIGEEVAHLLDFTAIPAALDDKFAEQDEDSALRATIINIGTTWTKKFHRSLLSDEESQILQVNEQKEEKQKAFDLLDSLSRSGSLSIDAAELHVILAATHCFDKSLINTVIQDNINPIEKLERSALIIASTIQDKPAIELIKPDTVDRVRQFSAPKLLAAIAPIEESALIAAH